MVSAVQHRPVRGVRGSTVFHDANEKFGEGVRYDQSLGGYRSKTKAATVSMDVIMTQRSVSRSPNGSPVTMQTMLEFAARHGISPQTEHFPLQLVNDALVHLEAGRLVTALCLIA